MPLLSLIEDQAYQLKHLGIKCFQFSKFGSNSNLSKNFFNSLLTGDDDNL